jgi:hypothetical protein
MRKPVTFTREQLYELVWQKPIYRLAEEYEISNVGLSKICGRAGIPTPPRGYWALFEVGRAPQRPPLPKKADVADIRLMPREAAPAAPTQDPLSMRLAEEQKPENRVVVPERLHAPCELVQAARAALESAKENEFGIVVPPSGCLAVKVSRAQHPRALRIADALLKAIASRGWDANVSQHVTNIVIDGMTIGIAIDESTKTEERPVKPDLGDGYSFHYNRRELVRRPSGRLSITLKEEPPVWAHDQRRSWKDSPTRPIDQFLNGVLGALITLSVAMKAARERREREARAEEARRRQLAAAVEQQEKLRERVEEEEARLEELRRHAKAWREAKNLRRFIEEARVKRRDDAAASGFDFDAWAAWAHVQADRLDPLTPSPPSILDEAERIDRLIEELGGRP